MLHLSGKASAFLPERLLQLGKTEICIYEMSIVGKLPLNEILGMTLGFQGPLLNVRIKHLSIEKLYRPNKNL